MPDINQTSAWVTARLTELGNATNEGLNTIVTSGNIGTYTAANVSGVVAITNGGTGASTVAGAVTNLGIPTIDQTYSSSSTNGMSGVAISSVVDELKAAIAASYPSADASGNLITIPDGADGIPVKDLTVNITPVQAGSGDPSPTNVRTISGWTAIRVRRAGKNILQRQNTGSSSSNGVSFVINADGSVTASGTASANAFTNYGYTYNILKLPKGVQLRVSGGDSSVSVRIYYMEEGTTASQMLATSASGSSTFTVPDNAGTVWARIFVLSGTVISDPITVYPMVTVADNDTEYEEYQGDVYVVSTDDAGTVYGGTLDVTTGVLTVTHRLFTFDGTNHTTPQQTSGGIWYVGSSSTVSVVNNTKTMISNQYSAVAYGSGSIVDGCIRALGSKLYIYDNRFTDSETATSLLTANPVQIVYPLATPGTYQLTTTEVTTLLGLNNIWADCGNTELVYRADPTLYVEQRLNAQS